MIRAYHLKFKAPLHLGVEGNRPEKAEKVLHSDTIFNALAICHSLLYGSDIEQFCQEPPVLVSSAFPYIDDTHFFPVPAGFPDFKEIPNNEGHKEWRKITHLPEDVFKKYLQTGKVDINMLKKELSNDQFYKQNLLQIGSETDNPRIATDRLTNTVKIDREGEDKKGYYFHSRDYEFYSHCGLFIVIKYLKPETIANIEAALRLLGDNGLGADRSVGRGQFEIIESQELDYLKEPAHNQKGYTLSLYHPTEDEVLGGVLQGSQYALLLRNGHAGWMGVGNLVRQRIVMLGEGSLISSKSRTGGKVVKVIDKEKRTDTPFNVYRCGLGLLAGIGGSV